MKVNTLYELAINPNTPIEERWEAVRKMRELRKPKGEYNHE